MNRTIISNAIARSDDKGVIILWIEYSGSIDVDPHPINYYDLNANGSYDIDYIVFTDPTGLQDIIDE